MSTSPDLSILERAKWLRDHRGFSVIAVDHPATSITSNPRKIGKIPVGKWKRFQQAHPTDADLERAFANGGPRNLAIVTGRISGVVGVDLDSAAAIAWADTHLPLTPMVTRSRDGHEHRFFRWPGVTVRNKVRLRTGDEAVKVDVRGDGGYMLAPGSVHSSGSLYTRVGSWPPVSELPPFDPSWIATDAPVADEDDPDDDGPADRDGLVARARAYLAAVPGAVEGQGGDHHTFVVACRLVRDFGLEQSDTLVLLREWNATCQPPWSEAELEAKLDGALKYGSGPIGSLSDANATGDLSAAQVGDCNAPTAYSSRWPDPPDQAAFRGLAGAYVNAILPYTEADAAAILLQLLVAFGNAIGVRPHLRVEGATHRLNEYAVVVGPTAGGRKGVALQRALAPLQMVDPEWATTRVQSGLSSGEGLLYHVRDATERPRPKSSRQSDDAEGESPTILDPGIRDKRLLAVESEFAGVLRVMSRDGNTLSALVRQAWDSGNLRVLTRHNPMTASGAHISIAGHITRDELLAELTRTDAANGFGNRFLWCCARRSKELPDGAAGDPTILAQLGPGFETAYDHGRQTDELQRTPEARELWHDVYHDLTAGRPGLLGAMLSRAEAHTARLACLYALLDGASAVDRAHLEGALAVWRYCEASARYIFGDALGNPTADAILRALRQSTDGLTRTEISALFGRNARQADLDNALRLLADQGLAMMTRETDKPGRPVERWRATSR